MAAADVQGRSSQDQFYQIRPEILQGVAPRTAVTRGGRGRQDSLKRSRSKLKRKLQGKAQFGQPARPLRPVIPLVGRNPGRGGMIMQIRAAPTTRRPAEPAVRADLSLSSLRHVVAR